jgi:hypothetical protein
MKNNITKQMDPEKLLARIDYLEENRRFIQNVLEMALSLGDFHGREPAVYPKCSRNGAIVR